MSADEDLRLNTLHRFAKRSPRLTLREYSHCEVPAGCGGVVLRWVEGSGGIAVRIRLPATRGIVDAWLDGEPLETTEAEVEPRNAHLLAFHVRARADASVDVRPLVTLEGSYENILDPHHLVRWSPVAVPGFQARELDEMAFAKVQLDGALRLDVAEAWVRLWFAVDA